MWYIFQFVFQFSYAQRSPTTILQAGQSYASDFILISPEKQIAMADRKFEVKMKLDDGAGGNIKVYKTNSEHFSTWEQVDAEIQDGTASFQVG